jgi:hypothetical protein
MVHYVQSMEWTVVILHFYYDTLATGDYYRLISNGRMLSVLVEFLFFIYYGDGNTST